MLLHILLIILIIAIIVYVVVTLQSAEFKISRKTIVEAPPEASFKLVNDYHFWKDWSPWAKMDPSAVVTYEGADSGTGAIHTWNGNKKVGAGKQTIIESVDNSLIKIKLEFYRPFKATNTAEFTFEKEGDETIVTWSMYGKNGFMGKAMNMFMDCDKMVGPEFEKGLADLKKIAELNYKK